MSYELWLFCEHRYDGFVYFLGDLILGITREYISYLYADNFQIG